MQADTVPPWLLPLLCCPHCMSALAPDEAEAGVTEGQVMQRRERGRPEATGAGRMPALPGGTAGAGWKPAVPGDATVVGGSRERPAASGEALRCAGCGRVYPLARLGADDLVIPRIRRDDTLATLAQDVVVNRYDPDSAPVAARRRVAWYERREHFLSPLLQNVARPYAIAAARDDAPPDALSSGEMAALDRFVALLPSNGPVLDLACGTGVWTRRLAARNLSVVGADGSAPSLARAVTPHPPTPSPSRGEGEQSLIPQHPLPQGARGRATFVEADMMEMPFAAASMAGVWCSEAFEYVRPDRRAVFFRQVHRVLRPGGVLFLSAETKPLGAVARQYLLWRLLFGKPVLFGEYIYRLSHKYRSAWHYHAMTDARTLHALCAAHGFRVLSLRREGALWLLLARKDIHG